MFGLEMSLEIQTGYGAQNMTVHSPLLCMRIRHEVRSFACHDFRLKPEWTLLQKIGNKTGLGLSNGKALGPCCCWIAVFYWFFGLYFLHFTFKTILGLCLDLDWVLKIKDWNFNAKYDSALIFGVKWPPMAQSCFHFHGFNVRYIALRMYIRIRNLNYLFVSRHEVHSMNTHTLQNAGW